MRHVVGVGVDLDFQPVGKVAAGSIPQHMAAGYQVQMLPALKEKPAGVGQPGVLSESGDLDASEQEGFDHPSL